MNAKGEKTKMDEQSTSRIHYTPLFGLMGRNGIRLGVHLMRLHREYLASSVVRRCAFRAGLGA